jgi:hypothetical protein
LKRAIFILVVVAVLIGGGLLTLIINEQGAAKRHPPPDAQPGGVRRTGTPEKGALFFIPASLSSDWRDAGRHFRSSISERLQRPNYELAHPNRPGPTALAL